MCRSIQPLFNREPAMTEAEVHAAALQYVRKISGFRAPSAANQAAFDAAVGAIAADSAALLRSLTTAAPPKNRHLERQKAQLRAVKRNRAPNGTAAPAVPHRA